MLRPSAFQNNGSSESGSKSILRPSSFQLTPSSLSAASTSTSKNDSDEPSTTSTSDTFENEAIPSSSSSTAATKEDDSNISSTTSNDVEPADNSDEAKVIPNPSNVAKAHVEDENETEATCKPVADDKSKETNQDNKTDAISDSNLFATNTKNLFAAAVSKSPYLSNNGSENSFVFGQNIHERIVGVPDTSVSNSENKSDDSSASKLFAVANASSSDASAAGGSTNGTEAKESSTVEDLTKVAREYEQSRAQKRKLDAVETFTGEEDESNILDMSCKLFAFVASNWEQRGPGSLRLNDVKDSTEDVRSRLVFRTLGNFRVLVNTKVWGGMVVEKPSQKSLRLTAIDTSDGSVKIYLVMARPDDISNFYAALKRRIEAERKREKAEESTSSDANVSKGSNDAEPDTKKERNS